MIHDGNNYSCAYDALFTILFNIWATNPEKWKKKFQHSNLYLSTLHDGFQEYLRGLSTLEAARDGVQALCMRIILFFFHLHTQVVVSLH